MFSQFTTRPIRSFRLRLPPPHSFSADSGGSPPLQTCVKDASTITQSTHRALRAPSPCIADPRPRVSGANRFKYFQTPFVVYPFDSLSLSRDDTAKSNTNSKSNSESEPESESSKTRLTLVHQKSLGADFTTKSNASSENIPGALKSGQSRHPANQISHDYDNKSTINNKINSINDITDKLVNVAIQTDKRESETQTLPFSPEYTICGTRANATITKTSTTTTTTTAAAAISPSSAGVSALEILTLASLVYGAGLPARLPEIEMIERARAKRSWEMKSVSKNTAKSESDQEESNDPFQARLEMMREMEMREWADREREICKLQARRLCIITHLLHERAQASEDSSNARLISAYNTLLNNRARERSRILARRTRLLCHLAIRHQQQQQMRGFPAFNPVSSPAHTTTTVRSYFVPSNHQNQIQIQSQNQRYSSSAPSPSSVIDQLSSLRPRHRKRDIISDYNAASPRLMPRPRDGIPTHLQTLELPALRSLHNEQKCNLLMPHAHRSLGQMLMPSAVSASKGSSNICGARNKSNHMFLINELLTSPLCTPTAQYNTDTTLIRAAHVPPPNDVLETYMASLAARAAAKDHPRPPPRFLVPIPKPIVRPPTPTLIISTNSVPDTDSNTGTPKNREIDENIFQLALCIQSYLRGRFTQLEMTAGLRRCHSLINELRLSIQLEASIASANQDIAETNEDTVFESISIPDFMESDCSPGPEKYNLSSSIPPTLEEQEEEEQEEEEKSNTTSKDAIANVLDKSASQILPTELLEQSFTSSDGAPTSSLSSSDSQHANDSRNAPLSQRRPTSKRRSIRVSLSGGVPLRWGSPLRQHTETNVARTTVTPDSVFATILQPEIVAQHLDYLEKNMQRLRDERRLAALAMMAERTRRMREAQESGRRTQELSRRAHDDTVFRTIMNLHHESIDTYLARVLMNATKDAATICAQSKTMAAACDAVNTAICTASPFYNRCRLSAPCDPDLDGCPGSSSEDAATVRSLMRCFLIPETEKGLLRQQVAYLQQRLVLASHHGSLQMVGDVETTVPTNLDICDDIDTEVTTEPMQPSSSSSQQSK